MPETPSRDEVSSFGLKEDWQRIEETLRQVIPVYDKVNRYISLGKGLKLRREGIDALLEALPRGNCSIIDLGCGPGKMTQLLEEKSSCDSFLLDALRPMMRLSLERNPNSVGLLAIYENLPFREESFDAAMAGFAIRDARILSLALREIHSLLKKGGYFLIVDLCKPNSRFKRGLISAYWRLITPFIAFFVAGRMGLKFADLFTTYKRLPTNFELERLISDSGFSFRKKDYTMLDGACVLLLKKD